MELDALPAGEAQGAVGVGVGQLVQGQVLLRRHAAAGDLAADHEHVMLAQSLSAAGLAGVAVLLLIGAVELQQLLVLLAEMIAVLVQFLGDRAAQPRLFSLMPSTAERPGFFAPLSLAPFVPFCASPDIG